MSAAQQPCKELASDKHCCQYNIFEDIAMLQCTWLLSCALKSSRHADGSWGSGGSYPYPDPYNLKGSVSTAFVVWKYLHVLRSIWFSILMKHKWIWNLSVILAYFLYSYRLWCVQKLLRGRTAERKGDSTWRTWYKQTLRMYYSRWPISWLIPEMQYPVIYIIYFEIIKPLNINYNFKALFSHSLTEPAPRWGIQPNAPRWGGGVDSAPPA